MTDHPSIAERRKALERDNPQWRNETIDEAFRRLAEKYRERPFVIADDGAWTYAQSQERAEKLAKGLRSLGVGHGDRVALLIPNYAIFAHLALATWRLGASVVPVNFSYKATELDYVIRQSQCKVVLTLETFRDLDYLAMLDQIAPGWQINLAAHYPDLKAVIRVGGSRPGMMTVEDLEKIGASDSRPLSKSPASPSETAVIMYTSGTTGAPKGVQHSHDQQLRDTYCLALHRAYEDGRRIIFSLPLYHAFGLSVGLIACIWVGGSVVLRPIFDPEDIMRNIEKYRPTDALFVPTMAMAIVEHPKLKDYDLSSLFACMSSAAATPRRVWEKLITGLGLTELVTGYGMTETTAAELMTEPDDSIDKLEQTIGHIMNAGVAGMPELGGLIARLRIVDPVTGKDVPPGGEGEFLWDTPMATKGYFGMPEATKALFNKEGWLKSGDLGRMRSDGYVQLTGRAKEQYKSGGELVSPKEVESVLCAHKDVAQAYVFGLPDERWGEIGAALVVPVVGTDPSEAELQEWCKDKLAKFKWPRHVFFCDAENLPKTATGKVQKFRMIEFAKQKLGLDKA
jgi:fatty-acyl-CoA synthase